MAEFVPVEKLKGMLGEDMGTSDWVEIPQDKIQSFADCTGDNQWIHVDVEKAKAESPFGGPIAHGFLTLSLIPVFSRAMKYFPEGMKMAVNYGLDKVRFVNPVPAGAKVRAKMTLTEVTEKPGNRVLVKVTYEIGIEGQAKPACVAEMITLFYL